MVVPRFTSIGVKNGVDIYTRNTPHTCSIDTTKSNPPTKYQLKEKNGMLKLVIHLPSIFLTANVNRRAHAL